MPMHRNQEGSGPAGCLYRTIQCLEGGADPLESVLYAVFVANNERLTVSAVHQAFSHTLMYASSFFISTLANNERLTVSAGHQWLVSPSVLCIKQFLGKPRNRADQDLHKHCGSIAASKELAS
eukprot:1160766-Pelagomonas_calceolata.AAC.12